MSGAEEFTRSPSRLARILGVDASTVHRWKHAGLPWIEPHGHPIEECRRWLHARREAAEARRAQGDGATLAALRRHRARLWWHRVDRARARLVPATWHVEQHASRTAEVRRIFEALAADLAPGLAGAHPRAVRTALEAGFRRVCEDLATARPEIPVPQATPVAPGLEQDPAVRPGESPGVAARRWLGEVHAAESARIEMMLAEERAEVVPLRHHDDVLAQRAQELRRALQAAARALATELGRLPESKIRDRLREELGEILRTYERPLPRPPEPTDTVPEESGDDVDPEPTNDTPTGESET